MRNAIYLAKYPKVTKKYEKIPKSTKGTQKYQHLPKLPKITQMYPKVTKSTLKYFKVPKSTKKYQKVPNRMDCRTNRPTDQPTDRQTRIEKPLHGRRVKSNQGLKFAIKLRIAAARLYFPITLFN